MALGLRATEAAKTTLRSLAEDPSRRPVFQALSERITLIRTDPAHRLARGVERQMQPSGVLARASVVYTSDLEETWVLVWTAVVGDEGEAVAIHLVEQLEA